jgi:hypothetical protein
MHSEAHTAPFSLVMLERHIQFARVVRPDPAETAASARTRLADKFPRTALRRMTHLGFLAGEALDGVMIGEDDTVVYASTYAETRALEDFLTSFPAASPLLFQTSIHPSAIQQVLIGRQQSVRRFWPMTGRVRLVESALLAAVLEPAARVVLAGGEEKGSWLLEQGNASTQAFAFALVLAQDPAGSSGRIRFEAEGGAPDSPCPTLSEFATGLGQKVKMGWRGAGGTWSLEWT